MEGPLIPVDAVAVKEEVNCSLLEDAVGLEETVSAAEEPVGLVALVENAIAVKSRVTVVCAKAHVANNEATVTELSFISKLL